MKGLFSTSRSGYDREKTSIGGLLAVVFVLGTSVATWATTCETPTTPRVVKDGTCKTDFTCRSHPAEYTDGTCVPGGSLPCQQVDANLTVQTPKCDTVQEWVCSATGTEPNITITCGWKAVTKCVDGSKKLRKGEALPQSTPPCTPPG